MAGDTKGTLLGNAYSGTWSGGTHYSGASYKPYLSWSITQNVSANKSYMKVTFGMYKAETNNQSYNLSGDSTLSLTVNGTTYSRTVTFDPRGVSVGTYYPIYTLDNIEISHNDNTGEKTVALSATHDTAISLGTGTVSGNAELKTIPRATTPILPSSAEIGSTITVGLNRANDAFTHDLTWKIGSGSAHTIAPGVGTSYAWTLPLADMCAEITTSTYATVTVTAVTKNGSTTVGTQSKTFTATVPASVIPSVTNLSVSSSSTNATVTSWGVTVKNYSKLTATFTANQKYGAAITDTQVYFSGTGQTITSSPYTSNTLQRADGQVKVRVKDARGRWSDEVSTTVAVEDYYMPVISTSNAFRSDSTGTANDDGRYITMLLGGSVSVSTYNTKTLRYRYREAGAAWPTSNGSPIYYTDITENTPKVIGGSFLSTKTYEVELSIIDSLGTVNAVVYTIPTESVAFNIKAGGTGAAFGKYATHDKELELPDDWGLRYKGSELTTYFTGLSGDIDAVSSRVTSLESATSGSLSCANNNGTLWWYRYGPVVMLIKSSDVHNVPSGSTSPAWNVLCTLPSGLAPAHDLYIKCGNNSNLTFRIMSAGNSGFNAGDVTVHNYSTTAITSATNGGFTVTYLPASLFS